MSTSRVLTAALLILAAGAARSDDPGDDAAAPAMGEFTPVVSTTCPIQTRLLTLNVKERVDRNDRTAAWLLEACVTGEDLPTSCLGTMTAPEALPPGMDESGRSFLVRCVPTARLAWVVDLKWTSAGLDLQAWKLDLLPLVEAPIVDGENGLKEIRLPPGAELVPEEPHAWKAGDPRPEPACVPLGLEATAQEQDLEVIIRAASNDCTSWRVLYDGERGSFTAAPLPGSKPPDLLRDAPSGPLRMEPGKPAPAPVPAAAGAASEPPTRRRVGGGGVSFSRR